MIAIADHKMGSRTNPRHPLASGLTHDEDGVDSHSFYETGLVVDSFVRKYRRVLRKLARA